jgi:hypothetical protein
MHQAEALKEHSAAVRTVAIGDLKNPGQLYPRLRLNDDAVERYQECLDDMPPIVVAESEDPALHMLILDGFHRWTAAQREGRKTVECEFVNVNSPAEFLAEAAARNSRHGLPLTAEERRAVAVSLWKGHQDKERIAGAVGRSLRTVERWLEPAEKERDEKILAKIVELRQEPNPTPFSQIVVAIKDKFGVDIGERSVRRWYEKGRSEPPNGGAAGATGQRSAPEPSSASAALEGASEKEAGATPEALPPPQFVAVTMPNAREQLKLIQTVRKVRIRVDVWINEKPRWLLNSSELLHELDELHSALQDLLAIESIRNLLDGSLSGENCDTK